MTIEELASVNSQELVDPPDWDVEVADLEFESFRKVVEAILGKVDWNTGADISTYQASCSIPSGAKSTPENIFMVIILSKFGKLFTVTYPWDMKTMHLERLVSALSNSGFRYAPFTLFASSDDYRWQYAAAFLEKRTLPPKPNYGMRHEHIWNRIFGHL